MNKKSMIITLAISLAIITAFTVNTQQADALGGFLKRGLKKPVKTEQKQETQQAQPAQQKQQAQPEAKSSEPVEYKNDRYYYSFEYPGNWDLRDTDPKKSNMDVTDTNGLKGSFIVTSTWMSKNFPTEASIQAIMQKAKEKKEHGELDHYELKEIDGVKGVYWVESDIDPNYKRTQFQAYGGGNMYNFTANSTVANYPSYKEKFDEIFESLHFDIPDDKN